MYFQPSWVENWQIYESLSVTFTNESHLSISILILTLTQKNGTASAEPMTIPPPVPLSETAKTAKTAGTQQYWLLKAEPETRLERGHDISFSIDDLAAKAVPEPWDGIRNFVARNNLRAMKKGDLAFFYHSSCKIPGIVGIMEIVQEHSPDLSAQDPKAPYHDAKDADPEKPKWSVVHVEFRKKLGKMVTLTELREFGELKEMKMLRQSRLSVSKVSREEWEFLVGVMGKREGEAVI